MTDKLYEEDSYLKACEATVEECEPAGNEFAIVLDRTVLFPEGGGQLSDTGVIGGVPVRKVIEKGGKIIHYCRESLPVGRRVTVQLNWTERLDHMQQHCGEHILSYAFWKLFGANNVGFHMSDRTVAIDLDKEVSWEEAWQAEGFANEQVWENRPVRVSYRTHTELDSLPMRKKNARLTGLLRLVSVEGGDVCTCCGTHPKATGVVGIIKISRVVKHKAGSRIEFLCGRWALTDIRKKMEYIREAGNRLSTGEENVCAGIARLEEEISSLKGALQEKISHIQNGRAKEIRAAAPVNSQGTQLLVAVESESDTLAAKSLLQKLMAEPNALAAVFYVSGERINYMFGLSEGGQGDCRAAVAEANRLLGGKGGGRQDAAQGSAPCCPGWQERVHTLRTFLQQ